MVAISPILAVCLFLQLSSRFAEMPVVKRWGQYGDRWCWHILWGASGDIILCVYADALSDDKDACEHVADRLMSEIESRGDDKTSYEYANAFLQSLLADASHAFEQLPRTVATKRSAPACSDAHAHSEGVLAKRQRHKACSLKEAQQARPMKLLVLPREQLQFVMTGQKTIDVRIVEGSIAKLIAGDLVCFRSGNSQCVARLTQVNSYVNFEAMLHNIHHNSCLPGCKTTLKHLPITTQD
jgi:ASC-1-like (ASCH) protein